MSVFLSPRLWSLVLFIAVFSLVGCDSGGSSADSDSSTGTVTGRITAADGQTAISGAAIGLITKKAAKSVDQPRPLYTVRQKNAVIDPNGPTTSTNSKGEYTLTDVPSGTQTLVAKKGVFEATFSVEVKAGESVQSNDAESTVKPTKRLAVVLGAFDSIESIVIDLGYANELDTLRVSDLENASTLNNYSFIFINCGSAGSYSEQSTNALRTYLSNGGTLYLSDLEEDYVSNLFPGTVEFNDETSAQTLTADILTPDLRQFVNANSVDIEYDLAVWARIVSISDTTSYPTPEVLLRGQPLELASGDEPLAITYDTNPGRVVYTNFHNESGLKGGQREVLKYYVFLP